MRFTVNKEAIINRDWRAKSDVMHNNNLSDYATN